LYQLDQLAATVEDEGQLIDRKLNVALTRAKKQLFVVGNPALLQHNALYRKMMEVMKMA
jgi:ATP-dependent exoDNAse (exonuclease V) beta subunit